MQQVFVGSHWKKKKSRETELIVTAIIFHKILGGISRARKQQALFVLPTFVYFVSKSYIIWFAFQVT